MTTYQVWLDAAGTARSISEWSWVNSPVLHSSPNLLVLPPEISKKLKLRVRCLMCRGEIHWTINLGDNIGASIEFSPLRHISPKSGLMCFRQESAASRNRYDLAIAGCERLLDSYPNTVVATLDMEQIRI